MNSSELYKIAYSLHYDNNEYDAAIEKYSELLSKFPDSQEAAWAKTQIENIGNMGRIEKFGTKEEKQALLEEKSKAEVTMEPLPGISIRGKKEKITLYKHTKLI